MPPEAEVRIGRTVLLRTSEECTRLANRFTRVYFAHGFVGLLSAIFFTGYGKQSEKMTELVKNTFKTNDDIFTNCAI